MNALPPPTRSNFYASIGFDIGVFYGLLSFTTVGVWAIAFPAVGFLIGFMLDD